ncbi:MAG: Gfo/Idh/MocA family oxidoreductase [Burkholderiales bacterium]|nr:Gfo/Idh/MocA family oxidoreductase [Burkholderiales bacterium]
MKKIGIGIIGLGMAARPHMHALRDLASKVDVIGCHSPSEERRAAFARTYDVPIVGSLEALLGDARIEVALILTPPRTHAELAIRAARAGKHVLLEKPVDVDLPSSIALVDAIAHEKRALGVVFQHRFRACALTLRALLEEQALGELVSVSASVRWWRSDAYFAEPGRGMRARDGGGLLLTQAIHSLDLLLDLAGPVERVASLCRTSPLRRIDTEDVACASVAYASGAIGVIDATTAAYPGYPERLEFAGTKGSAVIEGENLIVHRHGREVLRMEGAPVGDGGADPMAFSHAAHRRLLEDYVDSLTDGREPRASGRSALAVHALIDAMLESSRTGTVLGVASMRTV